MILRPTTELWYKTVWKKTFEHNKHFHVFMILITFEKTSWNVHFTACFLLGMHLLQFERHEAVAGDVLNHTAV